jgi:hypothetical protein
MSSLRKITTSLPIVFSSLRVGMQREMVSPAFSLAADELPEIAKLAVVEGVGLEPGVKIHR